MLDISPRDLQIVEDILQKHVAQFEVWAFGSRVKGDARQYSDLDLAVICEKPLSVSVRSGLTEDFSESDLPWKVDVVDWATTGEAFRKIILENHIVIQSAARKINP